MGERDEITGQIIKRMDDEFNRIALGEIYGTVRTEPEDFTPLTYERLMRAYDYFKPETLTIGGESQEIYGFKVHTDASLPDGVIILTEKMHPNSTELGKLVILFVNEGKGVIYDPTKIRLETPYLSTLGISYIPTPTPIVRARKIIKETWPELICGPDDFFEVFDVVDVD